MSAGTMLAKRPPKTISSGGLWSSLSSFFVSDDEADTSLSPDALKAFRCVASRCRCREGVYLRTHPRLPLALLQSVAEHTVGLRQRNGGLSELPVRHNLLSSTLFVRCRQEATDCGLSKLVTGSGHLCDDSLTHFIKALVLCRDPLLEMHIHGSNQPPVRGVPEAGA
jgi:hypothetical protein